MRDVELIKCTNGALEYWFSGSILSLEIPNPIDGKIWTISFQTGIHNHAYGTPHISRRGKKWMPSKDKAGNWIWVPYAV